MRQGKQKVLTNNTNNHQSSKQDNTHPNPIKNNQSQSLDDDQPTVKFKDNQKTSKLRPRTHRGVISGFSKLHFIHNLKYDSLFLSIDIFNAYLIAESKSLSKEQLLETALACFMLAIKMQQIYPPSLEQISRFYHMTNLSQKEYLKMQLRVLEKLDFNLNFPSPIKYLFEEESKYLKNLRNLDRKQMFKVYLFLEIALFQPTVLNKNRYICSQDLENRKQTSKIPWFFIMKAINLIYSSLTSHQNQDFDITLCSKKLILAKINLQNNHNFLYKKYKMQRFGCAALLHTYNQNIDENSTQNEETSINSISQLQIKE